MKKAALLYALWEKNLPILQQYLTDRKRVVIIPAHLNTEAVRSAVQSAGSELHVLPPNAEHSRVPLFLGRLQQDTNELGFSDDEYSQTILRLLQQQVLAEWPYAHGLFNVLETLTDHFDIELTMLNDDVVRDSKVLALWSRSKKIPIIQIAHGSGIGTPYAGEVNLSDYLVVPSKRSAEYFADMGVPEAKIHVLGNPYWDVIPAVIQRRSALRETFSNEYRLPLDHKWVLWAPTWNAHLSFLDDRDYRQQMMQACAALREVHLAGRKDVCLVYKDRHTGEDTIENKRAYLMQQAVQHGVSDYVRFAMDDPIYWVGAADAVVSYDSNMSIEAVLANVPAINVMSDFGCVTGGGYGARDGVLVLEPEQVGSALVGLFGDTPLRHRLLADGNARKSYFHHQEGSAVSNIVNLMRRAAKPLEAPQQGYVWQKYLNFEDTNLVDAYHTAGRMDIVDMFRIHPGTVLDVGCAAGSTGYLAKQKFPGCKVWGIEANRVAASIAQQRLDKVMVGMFDDFDLEREGLAPGTLDGVILADVLEHMYNPWDVMVKLRRYMSPKGQLVVSVPNARNLILVDGLHRGNWTYHSSGLLDITHIRFFTYKEIIKLATETGYRVVAEHHVIDKSLQQSMDNFMPTLPGNIETERVIYKNVTREEWREMCTFQFYLLLEKNSAY